MPQTRDAYALAHKGMRNILYTCALKIGTTDFSDPAQRDEIIDLVEWTFKFFDVHLEFEESDYHPILESIEPGLSQHALDAHDAEPARHAAIRDACAAVRNADSDAVVDAGWHLYHLFNEWLAHYVLHLDHEDRVLEPRFFEVVDAARMGALRAKVMAKFAPDDMRRWLGFFLPALSVPESAALLSGIRKGAPPKVFEGLLAGARMALGDRFGAVQARMG